MKLITEELSKLDLEVVREFDELWLEDENENQYFIDFDVEVESCVSDYCHYTGHQELEYYHEWSNVTINDISIEQFGLSKKLLKDIELELDRVVEYKDERLND